MKDTNVFNFTEIVSVFVSFKIFKESLTYLFSAYTSVKFSPILLVTCTKLHNKHSALKINLTYRHYFISGKGETSHFFFFWPNWKNNLTVVSIVPAKGKGALSSKFLFWSYPSATPESPACPMYNLEFFIIAILPVVPEVLGWPLAVLGHLPTNIKRQNWVTSNN